MRYVSMCLCISNCDICKSILSIHSDVYRQYVSVCVPSKVFVFVCYSHIQQYYLWWKLILTHWNNVSFVVFFSLKNKHLMANKWRRACYHIKTYSFSHTPFLNVIMTTFQLFFSINFEDRIMWMRWKEVERFFLLKYVWHEIICNWTKPWPILSVHSINEDESEYVIKLGSDDCPFTKRISHDFIK